MLVLAREIRERVMLTVPPSDNPQTIEVEVVQICLSQVRLGFTADKRVAIVREDAIVRHAVGARG